MVETIVEAHHSKIKKQNSKMYYIIFTEQFKCFRGWFLQGYLFKRFYLDEKNFQKK